jgi:hypothetical protein
MLPVKLIFICTEIQILLFLIIKMFKVLRTNYVLFHLQLLTETKTPVFTGQQKTDTLFPDLSAFFGLNFIASVNQHNTIIKS